MANANNPFGLRPVKNGDGSDFNGAVNAYYVPASDSTALFIGDPVIRVDTGANTAAVGNFPAGTLPIVTRATAGDTHRITGVVVGVERNPQNNSDTVYRPASTEAVVYVCDDPRATFEIQAAGTVTATMIGLNAVLTAGSGNTATGQSGFVLEISPDAPAADASNQLRILRLANKTGNELGAYSVLEVAINQHTEANNEVLGI